MTEWNSSCEEIVNNIKVTGNLPIIVYQMGKVGSVTIIRSLEDLNINKTLWHTHFFHEDFKNYTNANGLPYKTIAELLQSVNIGKGKQKLKVITLIRDPIARNISFYFDFIHHNRVRDPRVASLIKDGKLNIEQAMALFYQEERVHDRYLYWFDNEMKPALNFDIFEHPFQKSKGYEIYKQKDFDLLVMKTENIDKCIKKAFFEFLGVNDAKVISGNLRANREFAGDYSLFKKMFKANPEYIDLMYNSKVAKHFYTDKELNQFIQKWTKNKY